mgnify:CR=1 FL=1
MYSGRPIKLEELHTGKYEVDHIIPRSYIKDDSFENKVLVCREENQRKTNEMLIDPAIRRRMGDYWRMLHKAKLIGDKKFNNLFMRDRIDDKTLKGFVARQLVETSQSVKLVQTLLEVRYPNTKIVPVKANISHDLREAADLVKCREANDFHHAHDAYLACRVGLFIQKRHPSVYANPIGLSRVMRDYARKQAGEFNKTHSMAHTKGFIVNSFMTSEFDKETGEIFWDAEAAVEDIRRVLNYRQCFISRMPVEDTGAFWDQTIYSPRSNKRLELPLKDDLDPNKYGSYSREQFAYFFIYEARDAKKSKTVLRFAQVPVRVTSAIARDSSKLDEYASGLAVQEGLEFTKIIRRRILKKQLLELNGDRLVITGAKEVRNATEFAFTLEETALVAMCSEIAREGVPSEIASDVQSISSQLSDLFLALIERGLTIGVRLHGQLKLGQYLRQFEDAALRDKAKVIIGIISITNGATNTLGLFTFVKQQVNGLHNRFASLIVPMLPHGRPRVCRRHGLDELRGTRPLVVPAGHSRHGVAHKGLNHRLVKEQPVARYRLPRRAQRLERHARKARGPQRSSERVSRAALARRWAVTGQPLHAVAQASRGNLR